MFEPNSWCETPSGARADLRDWLTDLGSLTERLMATGRSFSVEVLQQTQLAAHPDEAELIGVVTGSTLYARHVALALDQTVVVVARSITRLNCPSWTPILQRGNRSLGLTLFDQNNGIRREVMLYRDLEIGHPLFSLARQHDASHAEHYPARRSNFILNGAALNVCEIFLPALESFL